MARPLITKDKFATELDINADVQPSPQPDLQVPVHQIRKVIKSKVNGEWKRQESNRDVVIKFINPNTPSKISSESPKKLNPRVYVSRYNSISSWKNKKLNNTKSSANITTIEGEGHQIIDEIQQLEQVRIASGASKRSDIKVQKISNFKFPTSRESGKYSNRSNVRNSARSTQKSNRFLNIEEPPTATQTFTPRSLFTVSARSKIPKK